MKNTYLINLLITVLLQIFVLITETRAGEGLTAYSFLFGLGAGEEVQQMHFKPDDGLRLRKKYEAKHGPRGRFLIEKLGQGYSEEATSILDQDQTITKSSKKKTRRSKNKARTSAVIELTTGFPSTMSTLDSTYDSTITTGYYDSTVETTYDSTTATVPPSFNNDDYYY